MNREDYLDGLLKYEKAELYLSDDPEALGGELYQNIVRLEQFPELSKQISSAEILAFFRRIKMNRQEQLRHVHYNVNMLYYLWLNELDGQLRASFVNTNNKEHPFDCELNWMKTERELIDLFLEREYMEGVHIDQLKITENFSGVEHLAGRFRIHVYTEVIDRSTPVK
jgi:hypothetical protein